MKLKKTLSLFAAGVMLVSTLAFSVACGESGGFPPVSDYKPAEVTSDSLYVKKV